jgi:hypothetical protein
MTENTSVQTRPDTSAAADLLPAHGMWKELEAIGIRRGAQADDPLFVHATLPEGWALIGLDKSISSEVVDDRGVVRAEVLYTAGPDGPRGFIYPVRIGARLARWAVYAKTPVALPRSWSTLNADERAEFVAELESVMAAVPLRPNENEQEADERAKALFNLALRPEVAAR